MELNKTAEILTTILANCATIIILIKMFVKNFKEIDTKIEVISKKMDEHNEDIQKLTLYSVNLPIEDKLKAGLKYIKNGGNGATEVYYNKLCYEYKKKINRKNKIKEQLQ